MVIVAKTKYFVAMVTHVVAMIFVLYIFTFYINFYNIAFSLYVSLVVFHQVNLDGYEAIWIGENEVMKVKKDLTSKLWNKVGEKIGRGQLYGATRLMRGYIEPATVDDCYPPIGHLVFVVHGIGQNLDISDIVKSTNE